MGPQGCDVLTKVVRSREQWQAMLGEPLFALVRRLEQDGAELNEAGTRVWTALEAAMKAFDARRVKLEIEDHRNQAILFVAVCANRRARILSYKSCQMGEGDVYVAVVVAGNPVRHIGESTILKYMRRMGNVAPDEMRESSQPGVVVSDSFNRGGNLAVFSAESLLTGASPADYYQIALDSTGAVGGQRMLFRFPLAFKDGSNCDGTLYFVRLFEWMGRLREAALRPVLDQLAGEFTSGQYAWVTNRSWGRIHRPIRAGEVVEVVCRFLGRSGPGQSMVSIGFDWSRVSGDQPPEQIATTQIQMTWAKVVAHGVVAPAPYPDYLDGFFRQLTGNGAERGDHSGTSYREALDRIGAAWWRAPSGPASGVLLDEMTVLTSANDSNLVGNIYYTKYYELQGSLRDSHFFQVVPEAYRPGGVCGGLRCVFTEVSHLRDAMPFDTVIARMYLTAVSEQGVELSFHYFRPTASGELEKLATGTHIALWTEASDRPDHWTAARMPETVQSHIREVLGGVPLSSARMEAA
jgi:acyl-CoA thioesterase FadM